jgi:hypothetical protein
MFNKRLLQLITVSILVCLVSACNLGASAQPDSLLTEEQMQRFELAKEDLPEEDFNHYKVEPDLPVLSEYAMYETYLYTAVNLDEDQFEVVKEDYFNAVVNYDLYKEFSEALLTKDELIDETDLMSDRTYAYHVIGNIKFISPENVD